MAATKSTPRASSCVYLPVAAYNQPQDVRWAKRTLSSNMGDLCSYHLLLLLITEKQTKSWADIVVTCVTSRGIEEPATIVLSLIFHCIPFWEPYIKNWDIRKQLYMWNKLESDGTCPEECSEKIWEDLQLHVSLIHSTETCLNNQKKNTNNSIKKTKSREG